MRNVEFQPIGIVHSPFTDLKSMPIQPTAAVGVEGSVEIFPAFVEGLRDLDGFSHVILLYHFHQTDHTELVVTPYLDTSPRGVFATRAPTRPNPIGLSVVTLTNIEANILQISNVDILDNTPLLDIKPYIPEFDHIRDVRTGWFTASGDEIRGKRSDDRFAPSLNE